MVRVLAVAALALLASTSAEARLLDELGAFVSSSGTAAKISGDVSPGLRNAAELIADLPAGAQAGAVAAEPLEGGAWRFRNAAGDTITATSPEGIVGALSGLVPEAAKGGTGLSFYLGEVDALASAAALEALPKASRLHVVVKGRAYPLLRTKSGPNLPLYAEIDPNVILAMSDAEVFGQALWQLERPLGPAGIRVASLDAGGVGAVSHGGDGLPQTVTVNADQVNLAFSRLRGQTLIVTGEIDGDALSFTGVSGASGRVPVAELLQSARAQDVNLLLLDAGTPVQPGGTTWLLQERGIAHLDKAMAHATLASFVAALAQSQGRMEIAADWEDDAHLRLTASPAGGGAPEASGESQSRGLGEQITDLSAAIAVKLSGHVVANAVTASLNGTARQWDLEHRLIPGIPAGWQWAYLASWMLGLLGYFQARAWWRFLTRSWQAPPEMPYRIAYELGFWLVFAPLVGPLSVLAVLVRLGVQCAAGFGKGISAFRWAHKGRSA